MSINEIINYNLIVIGHYKITVYKLILILIIALTTKIVTRLIRRFFSRQWNTNKIDKCKGNSIYQIAKYLIWILSVMLILQAIGININILIAGSAALLVGLGFGLQQVFNDIISGIILLFDGSVKVDDVVEASGIIGTIKEIGIRRSKILVKDNAIVILPNSKLVSDKVINWGRNKQLCRFKVEVRVDYGSDAEKVKEILIDTTTSFEKISETKQPYVTLNEFGEYSLNFNLYFWASISEDIEMLRSELRFKISKNLKENKIKIPIPQREIKKVNAE